MKDFLETLGVEFEEPLTFKGYLALLWIGLALPLLTISEDAPFWAILLVVVNFFAAIATASKVLPKLKDEEDE